MNRNPKPFVAARAPVKRSTSRVKDLQNLFSRAGGSSSASKGPYTRPTISAPFVAEPRLTEQAQDYQQEDRKPENYGSMRSLFPIQGIAARRQPSRERGGKSEPATPTPESPPESPPLLTDRKPSHKLPALVRDHAVVFKAKDVSEDENHNKDENDHVEVSISSLGRNRNRKSSGSSLESSSVCRSSSISSNYSTYSARKTSNVAIGRAETTAASYHRRSKVEVAMSNSFSSENSFKEPTSYMKTSESSENPSEESQCEEVPSKLDELVKEVKENQHNEKELDKKPSLASIKQKLVNSTTKVKPSSYVGFSKLPYQVYRKAVMKGFEFNLLVAGESGLGKSSLINSMFWTEILRRKEGRPKVNTSGKIQSHKVSIREGDVKLSLNVLELPGFGDGIDNTRCWEPISDYVQDQFDKYLQEETRINRLNMLTPDTRVHACLYFISPTGHGLKPLDIQFLQQLQHRVNIIPVIAKADTFTAQEQKLFKLKVRSQLIENGISLYKFGSGDTNEEDENEPPFAVVGSNVCTTSSDGRLVRGREYPWGTVNIENKDHCDFSTLQNLLWAYNTQDMIDTTHRLHYENFRCQKLIGKQSSKQDDIANVSLLMREEEKNEHNKKLAKVEMEMTEVFKRKVDQKVERIKETEESLNKNMLDEIQKLEREKNTLKLMRERFLKEKKIWEREHSASAEDLRPRVEEDSPYPDIPKNWGFMTLKRNKKK
eukprot:GFUD01044669.1.p1 GENE.GFUD01044669.1~~GFUD01044669.1.p1  ORF type:complete len:716 (-),score=198.32 GFUD01044669.1:58-2205(-)